MHPKKKRPPAATGDLGICHRQAAFDGPENSKPHAKKQDFRANWLARRFNLALSTASAVAALHFGEVRA
jgi:hypothetical protein